MSNALAVIEAEFKPRLPILADVLAPYKVPAASFQAGAMAYFNANGWLLQDCDPQSIMNAVVTFAVQGIHLDPGSQHACVVKFKKKAQPITMVRGFTVLAARSGYTLQGRLVREGDKIKELGGTDPRIEHEPVIGNKGKIIGAYAVARSRQLPTLFTPFVTIDDIIATRDRSKGYQAAKQNGNPHPWITDFDAMAVKTPKRLLAKDIPNDMLGAAAWLETQHDLGRVAYLSPDGKGIVDTTAEEVFPPRQPQPTDAPPGALPAGPSFRWFARGEWHSFKSADERAAKVLQGISAATADQARAAAEKNAEVLDDMRTSDPDNWRRICDAIAAKGVA